jgi:pimeloyl-ACP methyl ester carboxylesterase
VLVNKALAEGIESIAATWARPMIAPCNQSAVLAPIVAMVGRMTGEIYAGQTRALLNRPDATADLAAIKCPTLVLCGAQDAWSPADRHERMTALIPDAEFRVIEDCGHMSTMERPAEVTTALLRWLESRGQ